MDMTRMMRRAILPALLLATCAPAGAADVGRFAVVQNQVTSLRPGSAAPVPAAVGAGIALEEQEMTGPSSAAKMLFGEGAVISLGQKTTFKVTREAVAEAAGESASNVELLLGKARVFVSRFWGGRPEVRVNTPTAVVGIKGSEVGIEVKEDGTTVVTVISGSAWVQAKQAGASRRDLGAGRQVRVDARGQFAGGIETVTDVFIDDFRKGTEPDPLAPRELPGKKPTSDAPTSVAGGAAGGGSRKSKSRFEANTTAASSRGTLFSDPASSALPEPIAPPRQKPN